MDRLENLKEFFLEHKYWLVVGGIAVLVSLGIIIYFVCGDISKTDDEILLESVLDNNLISNSEEQESDEIEECYVTVDIKGEVTSPGLFQLKCDSRVQDVIDAANGVTNKADTSVLNLSKKVIDEMVIVVYSKEQVLNFIETKDVEQQIQESCQTQVKNDACVTKDDLIDNVSGDTIGDTPVKNLISLNSASKEELMSLTGIGESKAENIILYREENGNFKSVDEIKNVKGIGDSIFEKIKDYIMI